MSAQNETPGSFLKYSADGVLAQIPHLGNLCDGVVSLMNSREEFGKNLIFLRRLVT